MTELLEQGRQGCLPFEPEDKSCSSSCITYFYWPEIQRLCQGEEGVRPPRYDVSTKCHLLSMDNPYLKIGPFLLENKNTEGNYVAQIHNIVSPAEMEAVKEKTKTRLKATPYLTGQELQEFSYDRTSKVHYLSERTDNLTRRLTKRLELAMAYNIYVADRPYVSENYQIMNYGIGGKIGLHLDTGDDIQENGVGGGRLLSLFLPFSWLHLLPCYLLHTSLYLYVPVFTSFLPVSTIFSSFYVCKLLFICIYLFSLISIVFISLFLYYHCCYLIISLLTCILLILSST